MRKTLIALLVFAAVFTFADAYHQAQQYSVQELKYAPQRAGQPFDVPADAPFAASDGWQTAYPLLRDAAIETRVNLFRTAIGYSPDNDQEIVHYVLLTGPTRFTQGLNIENGRFLTPEETQQSGAFVSSSATGDPNQVGRLALFGPSPRAEVRSLQQVDTYLLAPGRYWVEAPSPEAYDAFLGRFAEAVNAGLPPDAPQRFTPADFTPNPSAGGGTGSVVESFGIWGRSLFKYVPEIRFLVATVTVILMVYYSFQTADRIGILKLHGASNLRVWYAGAGQLVIGLFLLSLALSGVAAMVLADQPLAFLADVAQGQAVLYGLVAVASLALFVYSSRIRISDAIKHRKDTAGIFGMNLLIKAGWSVAIVALLAGVWFDVAAVRSREELYERWQQAPQPQEYAIFHPFAVGHGLADLEARIGDLSSVLVMGRELYPRLNAQGALYVEASAYTESSLRRPELPGTIRSMRVNPNYLRQFPLTDAQGQPVDIPESTSDWVVLVPERYRDREPDILSSVQQQREQAYTVMQGHNFAVPETVRTQQVRIVRLTSGQRVPSLDPAVFPDNENAITDPIIEVMTEGNSLASDRLNMINGEVSTPLKVRLIDGDPERTYQTLEPELQRLGLADQLRRLETINEAIASDIEQARQFMRGLAAVGLALFASSLFLVAQNLAIYFTRHRQRILVRRLFGVGLIRTYQRYALLFAGLWAVQGLIAMFVVYNIATTGPPGSAPPAAAIIVPVLGIIGGLVVLEAVASAVAIRRIEQRSLPEALKEGA